VQVLCLRWVSEQDGIGKPDSLGSDALLGGGGPTREERGDLAARALGRLQLDPLRRNRYQRPEISIEVARAGMSGAGRSHTGKFNVRHRANPPSSGWTRVIPQRLS